MQTTFETAKSQIMDYFASAEKRIYKREDLRILLSEQRMTWKLASSVKLSSFINFLLSKTKLKEIRLPFISRSEIRFIWDEVSVYELAISLKDDSFFSHHTAAFLNSLTDYEPPNVYVNSEQPRKGPKGTLTQDGLNMAFKGAGRTSQNYAHYGENTIWLLSSMGNGHYGIVEKQTTDNVVVSITNIERTLIDMTVRPFYSGGVCEVLNAYKRAKGKISIERIAETLRIMDFVYPFHQSIGFYLENSGDYTSSELDLFLLQGLEYDFYLTYGMQDALYSKKWRLYYPSNLIPDSQ